MQQVYCSLVHSEGSQEASEAAGGAVQCSSIPELFAKAASRQPERDPSSSAPCTIALPLQKGLGSPCASLADETPMWHKVQETPASLWGWRAAALLGTADLQPHLHSHTSAPSLSSAAYRSDKTKHLISGKAGVGWACSEAQQHLGQIL